MVMQNIQTSLSLMPRKVEQKTEAFYSVHITQFPSLKMASSQTARQRSQCDRHGYENKYVQRKYYRTKYVCSYWI
jgi:hypothetical protein